MLAIYYIASNEKAPYNLYGGDNMEEKPRYYNQARNKAAQKYAKENLEQIAIRVKKGERAALKAEADKAGQSMAQYIIGAVNDKAGRQVLTPSEMPLNRAENGEE